MTVVRVVPLSIGLLFALILFTGRPPSSAATSTAPPAPTQVQNYWPCLGHDPQHSGRSLATGPATATEKWGVPLTEEKASSGATCSIVIGADGVIYLCTEQGFLYAFNPDGTQKWVYKLGVTVFSSPALAPNGTIYVLTDDRQLYALNPDGTRKWVFPLQKRDRNGMLLNSPLVGADGTIYFGPINSTLYAINPDGTEKWATTCGNSTDTTLAIAADGVLYITFNLPDLKSFHLQAINPDTGTTQWGTDVQGIHTSSSPPLIGPDGTIYIEANDQLYAMKPDNSIKWSRSLNPTNGNVIAIDMSGSIYWGDGNGDLHIITLDGVPKLLFPHPGRQYEKLTAAVSDASGTLYFGVAHSRSLYAINPDGTRKWVYDTNDDTIGIACSPVMGGDGTIYFSTTDRKLHAIGPGTPPAPSAPPIITGILLSGTVLVPLRPVAEWMGATVAFEETTSFITIKKDHMESVELTLGSQRALVGGVEQQLSKPAQAYKGVTYVPLRFLVEAMRMKVYWNEATQTAVVEAEKGGSELYISVYEMEPGGAYGTTVNPVDGAVMVWVPDGPFQMGFPESETTPQHTVTLDGYWIYRDNVTVAQYRKFCAATGYTMPSTPFYGWKEDAPITNVTWDDAAAYGKWAGVSLPTEAQWEKAARGTDGRNYPWGGSATPDDPYNGWDETKCSCYKNSHTSTIDFTGPHTVGSFPAGNSPYGARDMTGSVWQWCADWYDPDYYTYSPSMNPTGPAQPVGFHNCPKGAHAIRGGDFWYGTDAPEDGRCAVRAYTPIATPDTAAGIASTDLPFRTFRCISTM